MTNDDFAAQEKQRELEKLAAIGRHLVEYATWRRVDDDNGIDEPYAMLCIAFPYNTDLSCKVLREDAVLKLIHDREKVK